jgi:hypothetical protein
MIGTSICRHPHRRPRRLGPLELPRHRQEEHRRPRQERRVARGPERRERRAARERVEERHHVGRRAEEGPRRVRAEPQALVADAAEHLVDGRVARVRARPEPEELLDLSTGTRRPPKVARRSRPGVALPAALRDAEEADELARELLAEGVVHRGGVDGAHRDEDLALEPLLPREPQERGVELRAV